MFFRGVKSPLVPFVPSLGTILSTIIVFTMLATETLQPVPDYTPPTNPGLKVPHVVPGKSDGRDIEGDFPLDQIVIDRKHFYLNLCNLISYGKSDGKVTEFPLGTQVISCDRYGASAWTVTARIVTLLPNGEPQLYFLKACSNEWRGRRMG